MKIRVQIDLDTDSRRLHVETFEVFEEGDEIVTHNIPDSVTKSLMEKALEMYEVDDAL